MLKRQIMRLPHFHLDENGEIVRCYHECKSLLKTYAFWIGMTIGFPIEHFIWNHIPPFSWLGQIIMGH